MSVCTINTHKKGGRGGEGESKYVRVWMCVCVVERERASEKVTERDLKDLPERRVAGTQKSGATPARRAVKCTTSEPTLTHKETGALHT